MRIKQWLFTYDSAAARYSSHVEEQENSSAKPNIRVKNDAQQMPNK